MELVHVADLRCEQRVSPLGLESLSPRLGWRLVDGRRGARQSAYHIQAASSPELLAAGRPDIWDTGVVSSPQSQFVAYDGPALASRQRVYWRVRVADAQDELSPWSDTAWWEMGLLHADDWTARWIGREGVFQGNWEAPVLSAPLFRRTVHLSSVPTRARAYFCGLGYSELIVNGRKVGDSVLDPIVTQYDQHAGYRTLDITDYLVAGENVIGALLGNGWYNCHTPDVWHFDKARWRDYPKMLLQVEATLGDGEEVSLVSDPSWRVADSPITFDSLRNGETYDARLETAWTDPAFDDGAWGRTALFPGPGGVLISQQASPCRVTQTLEAVDHWEVERGVWVYDFGQNIAGIAQLTASAPPGTEAVMRYAENLTASRDIDQTNIGPYIKKGEVQTDRYIFKGDGRETWEPRFTFHGFQYVQLSGLPDAPPRDALLAKVIRSDFDEIGEFSSSDPTLNRLQECTQWSYIGNFVGIPTDCPHREKNGWTGDALLAVDTGLYNYNAGTAYEHWLSMMADIQRPNGEIPGIVPSSGWGYNWGNGPAWDTAMIGIPWAIYLHSGDNGILEAGYEGMKKYVSFLRSMTTDGIVRWGLGDWCPEDHEKTSKREVITTAYAYMGSHTMAKIAAVLGRDADVATFDSLAQFYRDAWRREFVKPGGHVAEDEQTSLACALHFRFVEGEEYAAVARRLVEVLERDGGLPTFGIHGAKWILRALADAGYADVAYRLLMHPEYPGWVNCLSRGATTLWEDWHGKTSRNHIMYGDISAWMYAYLAGIRPDADRPGFRRTVIQPHFVQDLEVARGSVRSPYGEIVSAWERSASGAIALDVTVPPNTTAEIILPVTGSDEVTVHGQPLAASKDLHWRQDGACMAVDVPAGSYQFEF